MTTTITQATTDTPPRTVNAIAAQLARAEAKRAEIEQALQSYRASIEKTRAAIGELTLAGASEKDRAAAHQRLESDEREEAGFARALMLLDGRIKDLRDELKAAERSAAEAEAEAAIDACDAAQEQLHELIAKIGAKVPALYERVQEAFQAASAARAVVVAKQGRAPEEWRLSRSWARFPGLRETADQLNAYVNRALPKQRDYDHAEREAALKETSRRVRRELSAGSGG